MKFNIGDKEYEVVDILYENNQNYIIYTDSKIDLDNQNVYAARFEFNDKEIKLNEIIDQEEKNFINKKINEILGD